MSTIIPDRSTFEEVGEILTQALLRVPPNELPSAVGWFARLQSMAQMRMLQGGQAGTQPPEGDRLLTVHEASTKLGMTTDYLYRHADTLPFSVRTGPKQLRFSLKRIDRYIAQKTSVHSRIDMNP